MSTLFTTFFVWTSLQFILNCIQTIYRYVHVLNPLINLWYQRTTAIPEHISILIIISINRGRYTKMYASCVWRPVSRFSDIVQFFLNTQEPDHLYVCNRDETIRSSHDTIRIDTNGSNIIIYDTIRVVVKIQWYINILLFFITKDKQNRWMILLVSLINTLPIWLTLNR